MPATFTPTSSIARMRSLWTYRAPRTTLPMLPALNSRLAADLEFMLLHRLEVGLDELVEVFGGVVALVECLDEGAAGAARPLGDRVGSGGAAGDVVHRDVGVVPGEPVVNPLVAAERAARHLVLHDVEVLAPRAVDLCLAVRERIVAEADARRQLLAEAELDRVLDAGVPEVRDLLVFGAEPVVQGEVRPQAPAVLDEERVVVAPTSPSVEMFRSRKWP